MSKQAGRWTTLGEVARWGSGGTPSAGDASFYGGDIPWAVIGDLNDGKVTSTAKTITLKGLENSSSKLVPEGAILIAMYGSIGKLGIASMPLATNQAIAFAIPHLNVVDRDYLFWQLMYERPKFVNEGKGATQQNISQTLLKSWRVFLPPIDEQREAVQSIESALANIESAASAIEYSERQLKNLRRAALRDAFEGLPFRSIGEVCEVMGGSTPKGILNALTAQPSAIDVTPFYKVGDLSKHDDGLKASRTYFSELVRKQFKVRIIPTGAIVFPKAGGAIFTNRKRKVIVPGGIDLNCMAVVPGELVDSNFLGWWFQSLDLAELSNGSILPQISKKTVSERKFPCPDLSMQKKIADELDQRFQTFDRISEEFEFQKATLKSLWRTVLHNEFVATKDGDTN